MDFQFGWQIHAVAVCGHRPLKKAFDRISRKVDSTGDLLYLSRGDGAVYKVQFAPPPPSDQARFVQALYHDVLSRDGESEGVQSFQQSLSSARQPVFRLIWVPGGATVKP